MVFERIFGRSSNSEFKILLNFLNLKTKIKTFERFSSNEFDLPFDTLETMVYIVYTNTPLNVFANTANVTLAETSWILRYLEISL